MATNPFNRAVKSATNFVLVIALSIVVVAVGSYLYSLWRDSAQGCGAKAEPMVSEGYSALADRNLELADSYANDAVGIFPNEPCAHELMAETAAQLMADAEKRGKGDDAEEHRRDCFKHASIAGRLTGRLTEIGAIAEKCDASTVAERKLKANGKRGTIAHAAGDVTTPPSTPEKAGKAKRATRPSPRKRPPIRVVADVGAKCEVALP